MASPMLPADIIMQFESLVDDSLDETTEYNLLNEVKDTLETAERWAVLTAVDESQSVAAGDTYLSMKTLPSDFGTPSPRGIYLHNDVVPLYEIPFELRIRFKDMGRRYYIDHANGQFALTGQNNPAGAISFFYQKTSPTLSLAAGVPWIFPARFHMILPYLMAKKFFAVDQPDKSRAWDDRWDTFATQILEGMREWNAKLILEPTQNANIGQDFSAYPNIIDMDGGASGGSMFG